MASPEKLTLSPWLRLPSESCSPILTASPRIISPLYVCTVYTKDMNLNDTKLSWYLIVLQCHFRRVTAIGLISPDNFYHFHSAQLGATINSGIINKSNLSLKSPHLFFMSSLMEVMRLSSMTLASRVGEAEVKGEVRKSDTTDWATWAIILINPTKQTPGFHLWAHWHKGGDVTS